MTARARPVRAGAARAAGEPARASPTDQRDRAARRHRGVRRRRTRAGAGRRPGAWRAEHTVLLAGSGRPRTVGRHVVRGPPRRRTSRPRRPGAGQGRASTSTSRRGRRAATAPPSAGPSTPCCRRSTSPPATASTTPPRPRPQPRASSAASTPSPPWPARRWPPTTVAPRPSPRRAAGGRSSWPRPFGGTTARGLRRPALPRRPRAWSSSTTRPTSLARRRPARRAGRPATGCSWPPTPLAVERVTGEAVARAMLVFCSAHGSRRRSGRFLRWGGDGRGGAAAPRSDSRNAPAPLA